MQRARHSGTDLPLATLLALREQAYASGRDEPPGSGPLAGLFRGTRHGQGIDFDDLRRYVPGDEPRLVDWKVTARTGALHTRLYREEKEHVASIALDLGRDMFTGSDALRAVHAGLLAGRLLWRLAAEGCRCGIVVALPGEVRASAAADGERGALAACALLADAFVAARTRACRDSGDASCLPALLDWLSRGSRRLGRLTLVTGFDGVLETADDEAARERLCTRLATLRAARELDIVQVGERLETTRLPDATYRFHVAGAAPMAVPLDRYRSAALAAHLAARQTAIARCCHDARVTLSAAGPTQAQAGDTP